MANLDPLMFAVSIKDEATSELNRIERVLNSIKDQTIKVHIEGQNDLRNLLSALQHTQVGDLGKKISQEFGGALGGLQDEAQKAIRAALGELAEKLASVKGAIQHDNFNAFSQRIQGAAESMKNLNDAFTQFHVTIGKDEGLRNFMTGLGEVIRNVRTTMGQLHSGDVAYKIAPDGLSRSIKVAEHESERLNDKLRNTQRTIEHFGDKGFDTSRLERYKMLIIEVRNNLDRIANNGGVHPEMGITATQYMSSEDVSRVVSLLNTELGYYKNIGNELERIAELRNKLQAMAEAHPSNPFAGDAQYAIAGLDLRAGLIARQGTNDALEVINSDSYRTQIAEATNLISRMGEANRQSAKDSQAAQSENEKWAASMNTASIAATNLSLKIQELESVKNKGVAAGVDVTALEQRIAEMRNLLTILQSMEAGSKIHGTASDYLKSADFKNTITLAENESRTVQKNTQEKERNANAASHLTAQEKQLAQALKDTTHEAKGQSQVLSDLKMLATQYLGVWGAQQFLQNIIQIGGQLESQRMSLTAILGQASYANDLFSQIQSLALKSPFGVVQLDQYSKNLSAFGFEYNELFDTTKRLADIAAGTGTDFGRLALAIGHVRSELALTGYTLRQFSMANVPMLKKLSENLGVTTSEIRKMVREKKVSYEDVMQVIKELTDEGGMFYNMQEVMSEAVSAKFKNLKDSMDIMYGQMAESPIGSFLKWVAESMMEVTKRWQTFGTVIASTTAFVGMYRMAMMLAANAQKAAATGLLQNEVITKQLTTEDLRNLIVKKQLTAQNVALALAQGKLNTTQAEAILIENGYTAAMVKRIAATQGMRGAAVGLGNSLKSIGATLFSPLSLLLVAAEAVIGTIMAYNSWSDKIEGNVTGYIERQKSALQETSKYLKEAQEAGKPTSNQDLGAEIEQMKTILKNSELYTDELEHQVNLAPSLSDEYDVLIKKMESANEQLKQLGVNAEFMQKVLKSTSTDMDSAWELLYFTGLGKLVEIGKGIKTLFTTGDTNVAFDQMIASNRNLLRFFSNDDINKNVDDLQKSMDALNRQIVGLDEYKEKMQDAIDNAIKFGYVNKDMAERMENRPFEEQIRILAEDSEAWNRFIKYVGNGDESFERHANNIREAAQQVTKDWTEIVDDDVPTMIEKLKKEYNTDEAGLLRMYQNNEKGFRDMLDGILASAKEKSPQIYAALMAMLPDFLRGNLPQNGTPALAPQNETPEQAAARKRREAIEAKNKLVKGYGDRGLSAMKKLVNYAKEKGLGDAKGNGYFDVEFVAKYFKAAEPTKEAYDALTKDFKKARDNYEAAVKAGNKAEIAEFEADYKRLDNAMDALGLDKSDKNHKNSTKKGEDPVAKALRERVRVLKEVGDSYQYWREKVGDVGAFSHVEEEFGSLLADLGITAKNVGDLRGRLQDIYAQTEGIREDKVKIETRKEISKELASLDRKDFEKKTEDFLSNTQIELENLTRAWDEFNQVLDATGDVDLARTISGANYIEGVMRTSADAVKEMVRRDYLNAGGRSNMLSFNPYLSDREIEEEVRSGAPQAEGETLAQYEERIKSIVESYKKWRDLQREVHSKDVQTFSQLIGEAKDYESQVKNIDAKLKTQIESIKAVEKVSKELKDKAIEMAKAIADDKKFKLSSIYLNLMNNAAAMTTRELKDAAQAAEKNLANSLKNGVITAKEYADEMEKIHQIVRDTKLENFWGSGAFGAFAKGGVNGAVSWYDNAINARITKLKEEKKYTTDENGKYNGDDEKLKKLLGGRESWENVQKSLNGVSVVAQVVTGAFEGLQQATQSLSEMFDALGNKSAADFWSDVSDTIGGISSVLSPVNGLISNAMSGNISGVVSSAISAPIQTFTAPITAFAKLHDKKRERQIEALRQDVQNIGNTLNTIKSLRERTLGYDNGNLRRSMYEDYASGKYDQTIKIFGKEIKRRSASVSGMVEYYSRGGLAGSAYRQEYEGLKKQREDYLKMYDAEAGKKHSSAAAMEEYKAQIAELDEKIRFYGQDLANELWGIDLKGWADQIGDALMNAFENGEDAAKAFNDTVRNIMQNVASNIIRLQIIEPMMDKLGKKLFGYVDDDGKKHKGVVTTKEIVDNPQRAAEKLFRATNDFMDAEGNALITAGQILYDKLNSLSGGILDNDKEKSSMSGGITSITEQTADILASYVNAMRADLSLMRQMQSEYQESVKSALLAGNASLASIVQYANAIMISNQLIADYTESIESMIRGLKNETWRLPVS